MGYRAYAGEIYIDRQPTIKINMLGALYEDVVVFVLGMSPRDYTNDHHSARQILSYQVLITRPDGSMKYDRYFRFNNPPWIHGRETDTKRIA